MAPSTTRRLLERFTTADEDKTIDEGNDAALSELTSREKDVVRLVAQGLSNGEIAEELVLAPGTVKVHVSNILTKLDARDRVQIVIAAFNSGLVRAATY